MGARCTSSLSRHQLHGHPKAAMAGMVGVAAVASSPLGHRVTVVTAHNSVALNSTVLWYAGMPVSSVSPAFPVFGKQLTILNIFLKCLRWFPFLVLYSGF